LATSTTGSSDATPWRGIAYLLGALMLLPIMDGLAKALTARYPVLQVSWGRFFFALLALLPFARGLTLRALLLPDQFKLQLARSMMQVAAVSLFFLTLSYLPLADSLALAFLYPMITIGLAALVLGEHVDARRWATVLVGFIGALVIIRPGLGVFQPASLFGLTTSFVFAAFIILTRRLAGTAPPAVILIWGTLVGALLTSVLVPTVWVTPSPADLGIMVAMGVVGAVGHLFMLKAYEFAKASVLAPLGYAEMVSAVAVGWIAFGDFPDGPTWIGIAIIVASGIYLALGAPRPLPRR